MLDTCHSKVASTEVAISHNTFGRWRAWMWDFTIDCICIISEVVDDVWEYLVCNEDTRLKEVGF